MDLLVVAVVVAVLISFRIMVRQAAAGRARAAARRRVAEALGAEGGRQIRERVTALAAGASTLSALQAEALVLACRQSGRSEIIPVLVALLGHGGASVVSAAALALGDLGSPALRAVWQALAAGGPGATAARGLLEANGDWLYERLLESFVAAGPASVERHRDLWALPGVQRRLELLATASDSVNRLRAAAIRAALAGDGNRVA